MENGYEDCKSLLSQIQQEEKRLRLKRRWLMGLPLSKCKQKQVEGHAFQNDRIMPESLLREDDVYYETIKTSVEKGFASYKVERKHSMFQDKIAPFDLPDDLRIIFSLLDDMTNKGLCHLAKILTGSSNNFEKTRWKMKKLIKESLPKVVNNQNDDHHINISKKVSQLVKDPHNFRVDHLILTTPVSQSCHAAAIEVLNRLEDLPTHTLSVMHRKLRGIYGYIPQLQSPKKSGWGRYALIDQVRKRCMKMLSEISEGDELQEPLCKAMAVAGLTLKLIIGCHSVVDFQWFPPEIGTLHNEIAKAIWLLKGVSFPMLKKLHLLLGPDAKLSNRSLRTALRKLMTEYLFEFSDTDAIPGCLLESLAIINKSFLSAPRRYFSKEKIGKEVECVLNLSAQAKQIVLELLPEYEFDEDFANAYVEDLEESNDDDGYDDNKKQVELLPSRRFHFNDSIDQAESIGENNPTNSKSLASVTKGDGSFPFLTRDRRLNSKLESMHNAEMDLMDSYDSSSSFSCLERKIVDNPQSTDEKKHQEGTIVNLGSTNSYSVGLTDIQSNLSAHFSPNKRTNENYTERQKPTTDITKPSDFVSSNFSCREANFTHDKQSMSRNQYLSVQDASDETSLVAYHLIGCILEEFAQIEGLGLDSADVSYLRGYDSIPKGFQGKVAKEERTSCEADLCSSVIIQALEELMPSFPKSGKERVKELMGLK